MQVLEAIEACREVVQGARARGLRVGLVPTMGALHKGHLSLIRAAGERCDFVVVTIFVNPTQFGAGEDYEAYPREREADLRACRTLGVDVVFAPSVETMYPNGACTTVHVDRLTDGLCGACRPGHFDGVATIVAKLFNIVPAHAAFFGEKDYQQLAVIRRLVRDLNVPLEIVACPTVREPDGLARSSRNAYLSPAERTRATSLSRALFAAASRVAGGVRDAAVLCGGVRDEILAAGPAEIEYVEVVDAVTLEPVARIEGPARLCLAVRIGSTRLIDNVAVDVGAGLG
ncbi:MAG: pantoate--beta-alanine ligase [Phycisphaerae bacterium]